MACSMNCIVAYSVFSAAARLNFGYNQLSHEILQNLPLLRLLLEPPRREDFTEVLAR